MSKLYFVSHPDVKIDPDAPVPDWHLNEIGKTRMRKMLDQEWLKAIDVIFSSTENKAIDGAQIVADYLEIKFDQVKELGEIDRTSTGYIGDEFWEVVQEFFEYPKKSARGWERAIDAQTRIVAAVRKILDANIDKNILIVSHGAVGALLLAHVMSEPISMKHEQPATNGGNYLTIDTSEFRLIQGWRLIDALESS